MPRISQNYAQTALWFKGNLSWKLHDGQKKIEEAYKATNKKLFVANCARRFGKSFWIVAKAIECAIRCRNKYPRIVIASATVKNLENFIIPSFRAILEDCPPELWAGWETGYLSSKRKFVFLNGSEIQLAGLDKDPDGGRGAYCDLYIIDEAGFVEKLDYLYSSVIAPMTLTRPKSRIIIVSTPSSTPEHDFKGFCYRAFMQKSFIELTIYDNPMMTPELIEEAKAECLTESDWKREYLVQHVTDDNLTIIPEWKSEYEVDIPRPEYFPHLDRYEAMDIGVKVDLTALLFAYWDEREGYIYIEDEAEINGPTMTTPDLNLLIRKKEDELWKGFAPPYRRIADNNMPIILQDLGYLHGMHFSPTSKDELHAMVNEVRHMVKQGKILIHPRCIKLLTCLKGGIWNKERKAFSRSKNLGHYDHLAALVYLVRNIDRNRDNIPQVYKRNDAMFRLNEQKQQKATATNVLSMLGINRRK